MGGKGMNSAERAGRTAIFAPARAAREALASAMSASLGTLGEDGSPFVSLVTLASLADGVPVLLLSRLAVHTQNLSRDKRASLLVVAQGGESGDPLEGARLTLVGRIAEIGDPRVTKAAKVAKSRFLARNPSASAYADFSDFAFHRLDALSAHLVAGFGRIQSVPPGELFPDFSAEEAVVAAEEEILADLNANHRPALARCAGQLLGEAAGDWHASGADPDGLDLAWDGRRTRLWFPERAKTPDSLRLFVKALAEDAPRR